MLIVNHIYIYPDIHLSIYEPFSISSRVIGIGVDIMSPKLFRLRITLNRSLGEYTVDSRNVLETLKNLNFSNAGLELSPSPGPNEISHTVRLKGGNLEKEILELERRLNAGT